MNYLPVAAVGFLVHPKTGKVLLHQRDGKTEYYPLFVMISNTFESIPFDSF